MYTKVDEFVAVTDVELNDGTLDMNQDDIMVVENKLNNNVYSQIVFPMEYFGKRRKGLAYLMTENSLRFREVVKR